MSAEQTFRAKAPAIVQKLLGDFPLVPDDGFAIVGNGGYECKGFTALQEIKPTIAGSRGGYGWFQWTGSRRRAFEAYCKRNKLDPTSDAANYAWLFIELKGSERKAIDMVRKANGRDDKVVAFELGYERAGVKHYDARKQWAAIAADAYLRAGPYSLPAPLPGGKAILENEAKAATSSAAKHSAGTVVTSGGSAIAAHAGGLPIWAIVIAAALIAAPFLFAAIKNFNRATALAQAAKDTP